MNVPTQVTVSFGDCDPAGIVFYPHFFAWADRAFHDCLRPFGGHVRVCQLLGAIGIGVIGVEGLFRRPARDGDVLVYTCRVAEWSDRRFALEYTVTAGVDVVATVRETRGVFCQSDGGIFAAETTQFRLLVGDFGQGRQ